MRILLLGAGGKLAQTLRRCLSVRHDVVPVARDEVDITNVFHVSSALQSVDPDAIVNAAAWTDVTGAETHAPEAFAVNTTAVRGLARMATGRGVPLVHFSSEFVFDGEGSDPYVETDMTHPLSIYGLTKLQGERAALSSPLAYVLRLGPPEHSAAAAGIVGGLRRGAHVRAALDRVVSLSFTEDVARVTEYVLVNRPASGLYHCANSGAASWDEIARFAADCLGVEPDIEPVRWADLPGHAIRPQRSALESRRLSSIGVVMPSWQTSLRRMLEAA
jgi:dTDP-4-dehydrorhamnose reductase